MATISDHRMGHLGLCRCHRCSPGTITGHRSGHSAECVNSCVSGDRTRCRTRCKHTESCRRWGMHGEQRYSRSERAPPPDAPSDGTQRRGEVPRYHRLSTVLHGTSHEPGLLAALSGCRVHAATARSRLFVALHSAGSGSDPQYFADVHSTAMAKCMAAHHQRRWH